MKEEDKRKLFDMVLLRIKSRGTSLSKYNKRWKGKGGGIEGWLRVEFVASIKNAFAETMSGGSYSKAKKGEKYSDILLKVAGEELPVELKASSTDWTPVGGGSWKKYEGHILIFICPASVTTLARREKTLCKHDARFILEKIRVIDGDKAFYLGLVSLLNNKEDKL
jgi:hypothetical protein